MKVNFVVSNLYEFWIPELQSRFIAEPFVAQSIPKRYTNDTIQVANYGRNSKDDLASSSALIFEKYEKYISILTTRLNNIHHTNHSIKYWKKALSLPFVRYITMVHDCFQCWESNFNSRTHTANALSEKSFSIPNDFEEQREFLQATDLGQEQLFSIYLTTFRRENINSIKHLPKNVYSLPPVKNIAKYLWKRLIHKISPTNSKSQAGILVNENVRMGLMGVRFAARFIKQLKLQSKGQIEVIQWPRIKYSKTFDRYQRNILAKYDDSFDRFDTFFFQTIYYLFPRFFVEEYSAVTKTFSASFSTLPNIKYVVSESWIFSTPAAFAIAELSRNFNVKHISCEHNVLSHPFIGHYIEYLAPLCDKYCTIGWRSDAYTNLLPGASLLPFYDYEKRSNETPDKKLGILYIAGAVQVKMPLYWSQYGLSAENASKHLNFVHTFFSHLPDDLFKVLYYRSYPNNSAQLKLFDKERHLQDFSIKMIDTDEISQNQMLRSQLIIVDYISTAHLEAISFDIPTIFFLNRDSYHLRDEYASYFNDLIEVGVCQTDPIAAANFVTSIYDDPLVWWRSAEVSQAVRDFLKNNLGKPQIMVSSLIEEINEF
jgi:putative transferase (TIGR04331 family)